MRAVAQRVLEARVEVAGETVGEMGAGILALVGVAADDAAEDAEALARKLCHLRIFEDDQGRMNLSLLETGGTLGVVSQFTLMADVQKGRRPSFVAAAAPEIAEPLVEAVVSAAREEGVTVITGRFRAQMELALVNHGPVTLLVDTKRTF